MTKRAVLYARVSGDDRGKDGRNLKSQLGMCREYALAQGYTIVAELTEDDRGASGADMNLEKLNQALEMARDQEFDVLVVREIDRFARNLAKQLVVETEFRKAGVSVEYVLGDYPDTPEGNLNKNIKAVIAEYERLKITERMVRGRRLKVHHGSLMLHGDNAPVGYRLVIDGKTESLEINEAEAYAIRLIYQWYAYGSDEEKPLSARAIAQKLNDEGVYHPNGRWTRSTVQRILRTETYAGVWYYGKYGSRDGKRVDNPRSHWIPVPVPAIVSRELWDTVKERRRRNKEDSTRNRKYDYLLARRVTCGGCGAKMSGCGNTKKGRRKEPLLYYRCPVARKRYTEYTRRCSNDPYFRAQQVDAAVWDWVKSVVSDPTQLATGLETYRAEKERASAPLRERLETVENLLAENNRQLEKLLDLYLEEDFPKEYLTERKSRLQTTIESLNRERTTLAAQIDSEALTTEQIQTMRTFAAKVAEGLEAADEHFDKRRAIIEILDVRATLTVEDGQRVAYVSCGFGFEDVLIVTQPTCMQSTPASHNPTPARRSARAAHTARRR